MKKSLLFVLFAAVALLPATRAPAGGEAKGAEPTCGQMMAGMSVAPAKLSEVVTAVADVLDAHVALMEPQKDKATQTEIKALRAIAKTHRQLATDASKTAAEMKKAESVPGAPHDMSKFKADAKLNEASQRMLTKQKELVAVVQKMIADQEAHK